MEQVLSQKQGCWQVQAPRVHTCHRRGAGAGDSMREGEEHWPVGLRWQDTGPPGTASLRGSGLH